jgi:hypothetical protein
MKEEGRLEPGARADGATWPAQAHQSLEYNLKRLAHRARSGKPEDVRPGVGHHDPGHGRGCLPSSITARDLRSWNCSPWPGYSREYRFNAPAVRRRLYFAKDKLGLRSAGRP